jgi:hypothetical protein
VSALLVSPHLIDLILGFTVLEAVLLLLIGRRYLSPPSRSGVQRQTQQEPAKATFVHPPQRPVAVILMLLPGVCLMLAIRAALSGAAWPWVPAALAAALVAHLADLRERWVANKGWPKLSP